MMDKEIMHPDHYNRENAIECIDEMVMVFGKEETAIFCKLNTWKYRYRVLDKGDPKANISKSDYYMQKYKELTESV